MDRTLKKKPYESLYLMLPPEPVTFPSPVAKYVLLGADKTVTTCRDKDVLNAYKRRFEKKGIQFAAYELMPNQEATTHWR
jgi:hypothetical protein